jgi:hypothetical protein
MAMAAEQARFARRALDAERLALEGELSSLRARADELKRLRDETSAARAARVAPQIVMDGAATAGDGLRTAADAAVVHALHTAEAQLATTRQTIDALHHEAEQLRGQIALLLGETAAQVAQSASDAAAAAAAALRDAQEKEFRLREEVAALAATVRDATRTVEAHERISALSVARDQHQQELSALAVRRSNAIQQQEIAAAGAAQAVAAAVALADTTQTPPLSVQQTQQPQPPPTTTTTTTTDVTTAPDATAAPAAPASAAAPAAPPSNIAPVVKEPSPELESQRLLREWDARLANPTKPTTNALASPAVPLGLAAATATGADTEAWEAMMRPPDRFRELTRTLDLSTFLMNDAGAAAARPQHLAPSTAAAAHYAGAGEQSAWAFGEPGVYADAALRQRRLDVGLYNKENNRFSGALPSSRRPEDAFFTRVHSSNI